MENFEIKEKVEITETPNLENLKNALADKYITEDIKRGFSIGSDEKELREQMEMQAQDHLVDEIAEEQDNKLRMDWQNEQV